MNIKNVSIIGCGSIAGGLDSLESEYILTHAKAITMHPSFELNSCCDLNTTAMTQFAEKWNIPKLYHNIDELLKHEKPDVIVIASNTESHYEILHKLSLTDVSIIICEKPLLSNSEELANFKKIFQNIRAKIITNYFRRFDNNHSILKNRIKNKKYGELKYFHMLISKGLKHNGSHAIDLLLYFFETDIKLIPIKVFDKGKDIYGVFQVIVGAHICGVLQVVDDVDYAVFDCEFIFKNHRIIISDIGYNIEIYYANKSDIYPGFKELKLKEKLEPTLHKSFYQLYEEIINNRIDYFHNLFDSIKVLEIINQAINERKIV